MKKLIILGIILSVMYVSCSKSDSPEPQRDPPPTFEIPSEFHGKWRNSEWGNLLEISKDNILDQEHQGDLVDYNNRIHFYYDKGYDVKVIQEWSGEYFDLQASYLNDPILFPSSWLLIFDERFRLKSNDTLERRSHQDYVK